MHGFGNDALWNLAESGNYLSLFVFGLLAVDIAWDILAAGCVPSLLKVICFAMWSLIVIVAEGARSELLRRGEEVPPRNEIKMGFSSGRGDGGDGR